MKYVNVVVDNKGRYYDRLFTYRCKGGDETAAERGSVVKVPFGKNNRLRDAYVFEDNAEPECDLGIIKEIDSVDPDLSLTDEMVVTSAWMKTRYGITLAESVKCFLPAGKKTKKEREKEPYKDAGGEPENSKMLTEEQQQAAAAVCRAIGANRQENFLLYGVSGSGKTEVYIRAVSEALQRGKTAIILVPEITMTGQLIERLASEFGKPAVAVLHSKLTARERFDEWIRIRSGEAKIVTGTRAGIFAPLGDLGLIILDEEDEAAYKSDMRPKYETVDIAVKRLMYYGGVLVLGSSAPSVVSYQRAKEGIYTLLKLKERHDKSPLPRIELVDMREELREGNTTVFSDRLYRKAGEALEKGRQVLLILNRRGYSAYVSCRECGEVMKCPECGISLSYRKDEDTGACRYCGKKFPIPKTCPACGSKFIKYSGAGTERVEEFAKEVFEGYSVERLDLDTATNRRDINRIIKNFSKGKTDILIGTQLIAKGLDFSNVGLVGVIDADVSLNIPDFRAGERTFRLVTQAAGRAGREGGQGLVIVQTREPDNFALKCAAARDYEGFFRQEAAVRRLMDYPPFTDLIAVEFTGASGSEASQAAGECRDYLIRCGIEGDGENIFLPRHSYYFKGKDSVRYFIMIKCPKGYRNKYVYYIGKFIEDIMPERLKCSAGIDVNPYGAL